ncbi:AraC-like ligand binding domain-containing protein [Actinopolymorpha singaporensis]|uniref:AraC-like ligand binding domain-containing protein n=1 Tax=Actinopolymorpha singaporensis TaxID=117157 RepID=A0A1H1UFY8_9ACTN|nr:AraC-like ligand binding domain-containing protein [Actinopolymorpha singaporensis]
MRSQAFTRGPGNVHNRRVHEERADGTARPGRSAGAADVVEVAEVDGVGETDEVVRPDGISAGFHAYLGRAGVPGLVHAGDQRAPTSWLIGTHRHDVWELYLQTDGPATRWRVRDHDYTVGRNGLLVVPPGAVHHMVCPASTTWHYVFAAFDAAALLADLPEAAAVWQRSVPAHVPDAGSAVAPFEAFLREVTTTQSLRATGLTLTARHLLVEVTRLMTSGEVTGQVGLHPAVAHARRLLDAAPGRRLPLAALARAVGLSPAYLGELFTEQLGASPANYHRSLRLRRAEMLLAETDASITQVAVELGFSSAQHFATAFRARTGRTPREFRRQWRGGRTPAPRVSPKPVRSGVLS